MQNISRHAFLKLSSAALVTAPFVRMDWQVLAPIVVDNPLAGYQANLRYGSQQSVTRDWSMPMHQTATLFHKQKTARQFIFGGEADNHALNTAPKETLVKITKAEDGGVGGQGKWEPVGTGFTPGHENDFMNKYLSGGTIGVKKM